jgi:uncharacterized protein
VTEPVLIDTGPIVAILSKSDASHGACTAAFQVLRRPPLTTWPVLTEAAWLLRKTPEGIDRLCALVRSGAVEIAQLDDAALAWIPGFVARYRELGVQLADASLVYTAEQRGITSVFTLDRRDFTVYRTAAGQAFTLLPDLAAP